jgi:alcohol dehydrogenase (cytochrome c)
MNPFRRLLMAAVAVAGMLAGAVPGAQNRSFRPVTDETLRNPPPADWLHWRGNSSSWGYSALDQINRQNVGQLQLAWAWQMETGNQQAAPVAHDGVMYLASPGGIVQALDGATGDLLWEYSHEAAAGTPPGSAVRGLSLYGDKVFLNTVDARIVALHAQSGRPVWNVQVADPKKGFSYQAGSIIAKGKVISGLQGCSRFYQEKCAITAHDANTGRELWRVKTIPGPGEPGDATWGDVPYLYRAGTDMWISGSYDADLDLIYWSTSQAKPWTRAARGTDGDALYSNSTLAIQPDTGKVVWYYQYLPGETTDMDEVFENILVDVSSTGAGEPRKSLFKMGKLGILWEIDRRSGQFTRASDLGYQNQIIVDRATGKVAYRPDMVPSLNQEHHMCPSFGGVKSWRAMSYSPETQAFLIPGQMTCQRIVFTDVKKVEGGGGPGQGRRVNYHHPDSGDNLGEFISMSTSGTVLWKIRQRAAFNTAALTTAGGLAFVGDWNRYINAYDVKSGDLLWQTRAAQSPQGFPISYAAGGRQFVAIPVGVGAASWGTAIPLLLTPELKRPNSGNAIMVFALPRTPAPRSRGDE